MTYSKYSQYIYGKYYRYEHMVNKFVEMQKFFDANYLGVTNYYGIKEFFATIYKDGVLDILKHTNEYCEIKNDIALDFYEEKKTEKEIEQKLEGAIVKIQKDMPFLVNYYNQALNYVKQNEENIAKQKSTKENYNGHFFASQLKQIDEIIVDTKKYDDAEELINKLNVSKQDLFELENFIGDNEEQNDDIVKDADKIVEKMKREQRNFKNSMAQKMMF